MPRLVLDLDDVRPIWALPDWVVERIAQALPAGWQLARVQEPADGRGDGGRASGAALRAIRGAEIYFGYGITPELFEAATEPAGSRLRWVHSGAAGVGSALFPAMRESRVAFTNSAGIHAEPIADTVLAMLLYFARGLDVAVAGQRERRWASGAFEAADAPVFELADAVVGVVGYGGIGRAVARRLTALGCRVLACKRTPAAAEPGVELRAGDGALDWLLERSDGVVLALPHTAATEQVIGRAQLERMRPGAVLVNVGRGRLVDEPALCDALRGGRLRGAALDVFAREPLPAASPLWDLPNLLITPHVSGTSRNFWRRQADLMQINLRRYFDGQPLLNVVDKHAGY